MVPDCKESACNVRDLGSVPGLGRSPGEGKSNQFWYSGLENTMEGGAWYAPVHEVTESQTHWRTNDTHWEKKGGWSRTWESDLHETVLLSQDLEYESWSCHQCQTSLFCKRSLLISRDFERIYWLNTTFLNSKVLYKSTRTHSYDFLKHHLSTLRNYHQ